MDRKVVNYLFPKCCWTKVLLSWPALLVLIAGGLSSVSAQTRKTSQPKIRIVIDASRDGGAWWFPQGPPPFDPEKPHQGVLVANYLKSRGWEVIEIHRETRITDQFKGAKMVVRFNKWGGYYASEVLAYRKFVRNGAVFFFCRDTCAMLRVKTTQWPSSSAFTFRAWLRPAQCAAARKAGARTTPVPSTGLAASSTNIRKLLDHSLD